MHEKSTEPMKFSGETDYNFNNWDEVFMDPVIANAILDRVLHHAHVIHITGKSYRLKDYYEDSD